MDPYGKMCKNDIESVQPDLITELNAGLADCLNRQIDNYFFDVARTDDCTAGTVLSGSALSGSLIAEAMGSMRNGNQCKWEDLDSNLKIIPILLTGAYEPVVLITHPVSMSSLLQDTNFVYACRYGNRDVITGGRVLEWLKSIRSIEWSAKPPDSHGPEGDSECWWRKLRLPTLGKERHCRSCETRSQSRI